MTNTATKRKPATPQEANERLNRLHGAATPKATAPEREPAQLPARRELPEARSLTTPEQRDMFDRYADGVAPKTIDGDMLKFSKGDYLAGENNEEIPEGTKMVPDMNKLSSGWVGWEDGKPAEQRMGRIADGYVPPRRNELGDLDQALWEIDRDGKPRDRWQFTNHLPMRAVETNKLYTFVTSSRGGLTAIAELCRHHARDSKQHPNCDPVIQLGSSSYDHPNKAYGKIKVPVFVVVGRAPRGGVAAVQTTAKDMDDEIPFAWAALAAIPLLAMLIGSGTFVI